MDETRKKRGSDIIILPMLNGCSNSRREDGRKRKKICVCAQALGRLGLHKPTVFVSYFYIFSRLFLGRD
jgi:hypothetical protein